MKTWMAGTNPAMTSLFDSNGTSSSRLAERTSSRLRARFALAHVAPRGGRPTSLFRRARRVVLCGRDTGLGVLEGDGRAPLRRVKSPQRPALRFLRDA